MTTTAHPLLALRKHLALLVLAPLLLIVLLFLLLGYGLHGYPIAVANEDAGFDMPMAGHLNIPDTLVAALDAKALAITKVGDAKAAQALYDAGKVKALLAFPADLTRNMMIKVDDPSYVLPERFTLEVRGDNPLEKLFVLATIARTSLKAMEESGSAPSLDSLPIPLDAAPLAEGFGRAPAYMVSAVLGFVAWLLTGILALAALLSLRKEGGLAGIKAGRFGPGFVLAFGLAGWLLYIGLVFSVSAILGIAPGPSFLAGSLGFLLLFLAAAGIALAAGSNAPSAEAARPAIPYLVLPLFFGGFLLPAELLPGWLQWLPWIFPPFYGLPASLAFEAGRAGASAGWNLAATALWAGLFLFLGILGLRRRSSSPVSK